jgi:catechol 2,3-dioxygenase-like lactoylglutathione lyase family enzyme
MDLSGITRTVASLEKSRQFCEEILGFEPDVFYASRRW